MTHFELAPPQGDTLGEVETPAQCSPLLPQYFPRLMYLSLENFFIRLQFLQFLLAHKNTLESICLVNCHAEDPMEWNRIFDSLSTAKPSRLRSFTVEPREAPFEYIDGSGHRMGASPERIEQARTVLAEEPHRRMFSYALVHVEYDFLVDLGEVNVDEFLEGNDQRAWDRLQDLITENSGNA